MKRLTWATAMIAIALSSVSAYGQTTAERAPAPPTIATSIDDSMIRDLPNDGTIFSLLETIEPALISDRISAGGAYTGQAPRIGGFISSWSQTLFRIGDVSLSDPRGSGAPLLLPDADLWSNLKITTGIMPADINAAGVAISLEPRAPTAAWSTVISGAAAPASSSPSPTLFHGGEPIAKLAGWDRASLTASGPLITDAAGRPRLGGFFAASWMRGKAEFAGSQGAPVAATSGSAFAHLVFSPGERNAVRAIGWVQKNTSPFDTYDPLQPTNATRQDNAAHLQVSWNHETPGAASFRLFGAYTQRTRTQPQSASGATFERLIQGPVSQLAFDAPDAVRLWTIGGRLPSARAGIQTIGGGIEIGGARDRSSAFFQGAAGELVDGIPARVWVFKAPVAPVSSRHTTTTSAFITDTIALSPKFVVDTALGFDSVDGSAQGGTGRIRWQTWLPRARAGWTIVDAWQPTIFAGVSRSAYRLPLDLLAIGDPGAPTASVYQWLPAATGAPDLKDIGALVAPVGPGSNGSAGFTGIDPDLKRPVTDELTIGIHAQPSGALLLRAAGFLRRERHLLALTDTVTPATAYSLTGLADPGLQLQNPVDDQLLPVYNRNASSFGQDSYLLTNTTADAATSKSIEVSAELKTARVVLFGGAAANQSEGAAANVGFGPLENDQDLVGDAFVDPNAATFARGRVFTDRAYTIKIASIIRLPRDLHIGIVARYQDGQPFSRLVVVPDLNQGAQAIRAFPNGQSRFTFTETVDARVQKSIPIGRDRLDVVFDVFNLLNTKNEVEEQTVSGSTFRAVTAIQPPRSFHAGFRVDF